MELLIVEQTPQKDLQRQHIRARITVDGAATPSRVAVRDALAAKVGGTAERLVIAKMDTTYGTTTTVVEALLYDNEKALKQFEAPYVMKRLQPKAQEE